MNPELTIKISMAPEVRAGEAAAGPPPVSLEEVITEGPPAGRRGAPAPAPLDELEAGRAVEGEPPPPVPLEQLEVAAAAPVAPAPAEQLPEATGAAVGAPAPMSLEDLEALAESEERGTVPGPETGPHATPENGKGTGRKTTRKSTRRRSS
jgi:hypothetical protein